jgi:hypothetical protein
MNAVIVHLASHYGSCGVTLVLGSGCMGACQADWCARLASTPSGSGSVVVVHTVTWALVRAPCVLHWGTLSQQHSLVGFCAGLSLPTCDGCEPLVLPGQTLHLSLQKGVVCT